MVNRQNYRWVKSYLRHLQAVEQLNTSSVGRYRAYLRHLLLWADEALLSQSLRRRPTFPAYVTALGPADGTRGLAPTTVKKIIQTSQRFFTWAKQTWPSEFRGVPDAWINTLRAPRLASPIKEHAFVTPEEVVALVTHPVDPQDLALRRDQATAALLFLSGMRVGALGSLPIAAVDLTERTIKQWPSLGVHTKNLKTATTYLLPIPELIQAVERWDSFIRTQLPASAMWYTPVESRWGLQKLSEDLAGTNRNVAVGKRLRLLYAAAGLPFKSAHKFRHGHAVWALQHAHTMADYKAVSQNLMHSDIRITDGIYAPLLSNEVQSRIGGLSGGSTALAAAGKNRSMSPMENLSKQDLAVLLRLAAKDLEAI